MGSQQISLWNYFQKDPQIFTGPGVLRATVCAYGNTLIQPARLAFCNEFRLQTHIQFL